MVLREVEIHGSIVKAAESLHLSPAAASQRLSKLSTRLGMDLTISDGRGIRLTPAGRQLAARAVRICRQLELAERELYEGSQLLNQPTVSVAAFATAAEHLFPSLMDRLDLDLGLRVSLVELPADLALPGVRSGGHDIAIVPSYEPSAFTVPPGTIAKVVATEPLHLVARPGDGRGRVTFASLADAPWISGPVGSTLAAAIESTCRTVGGFTPDIVHRVADAGVVFALAERGLGVGLLPQLATRSAPEYLVHPVPGAIDRSILAVCLTDSLDHRPVLEVWNTLDLIGALPGGSAG